MRGRARACDHATARTHRPIEARAGGREGGDSEARDDEPGSTLGFGSPALGAGFGLFFAVEDDEDEGAIRAAASLSSSAFFLFASARSLFSLLANLAFRLASSQSASSPVFARHFVASSGITSQKFSAWTESSVSGTSSQNLFTLRGFGTFFASPLALPLPLLPPSSGFSLSSAVRKRAALRFLDISWLAPVDTVIVWSLPISLGMIARATVNPTLAG